MSLTNAAVVQRWREGGRPCTTKAIRYYRDAQGCGILEIRSTRVGVKAGDHMYVGGVRWKYRYLFNTPSTGYDPLDPAYVPLNNFVWGIPKEYPASELEAFSQGTHVALPP